MQVNEVKDGEVETIVNTVDKERAAQGQRRLDRDRLWREIGVVRQTGVSVSFDRVAKGAGGVAVRLPTELGCSLLGVGVIGLTETIQPNIEMLADLMQRCIHQHLLGGRR